MVMLFLDRNTGGEMGPSRSAPDIVKSVTSFGPATARRKSGESPNIGEPFASGVVDARAKVGFVCGVLIGDLSFVRLFSCVAAPSI